jgi:hypothetical protein
MAERSMAVVLKTRRIGYDIAVMFCGVVPAPDLQYLAIIRHSDVPSELELITDRQIAFAFCED